MEGLTIRRIDPYRLEIRQRPPMRTSALLYANAGIEKTIEGEEVIRQVANVACLPGIVGPSMAMPDIHWGYGFPIGGVAAFSLEEGIISPGGVGYDINCGIRCIRTNLTSKSVSPVLGNLLALLYSTVPSGVGSSTKSFRVDRKEFRKILEGGSKWALRQGLASNGDLEAHEDRGCIEGADPDAVSERAIERGMPQLGTLGSGNHFLEIDAVDKIYDEGTAEKFGLFEGQILVLVHTGSRGLGHQICDDYVHSMLASASRFGIDLPDRQLACAPVSSREGRDYFGAMASAANFAFANRQIITHLVRQAFEAQFSACWERLRMELLYDCCHNIAKKETVSFEGKAQRVCIHRKGATRALPPGDTRLPDRYRKTGQPVLVPGDMGRMSYILAGDENAGETFFSACHGAGRLLSRQKAKKIAKGRRLIEELERQGIRVMAASRSTLSEEIPEAYKDVAEVVSTMSGAGVARIVARLRPLAMVKG
ncbi:MAG TPA: RtcB family protein [Deltaproteobacteria bacterium]|jgi:tRNA-splicing ligase RtcB|nr:RtcB family protein [Deltaproteobacteria bacterium]HQI00173.1 RtcB family protein [Deltaproteobacteria bacterium]HQJ09362.1 RtcB family protein [Deltaproteobacteria bacterium]